MSASTGFTRRRLLQSSAIAATAIGMPGILRAQGKEPIKIGMPTILSGRVAQLGISSRNAAQMVVEEFNAAGGLELSPLKKL